MFSKRQDIWQQPLLDESKEEETQLLKNKKLADKTKKKVLKLWDEKREDNINVMKALTDQLAAYLQEKTNPEYKDENPLDAYDKDILTHIASLLKDMEKALQPERLAAISSGEIYYEKECLLATWHVIQNRGDAKHLKNLTTNIDQLNELRIKIPLEYDKEHDLISPKAKDICKISGLITAPFVLSGAAAYAFYRELLTVSDADDAVFGGVMVGALLLMGLGTGAAVWYRSGILHEPEAQQEWEASVKINETKHLQQAITKNVFNDFKFFAQRGKKEVDTMPAAVIVEDTTKTAKLL